MNPVITEFELRQLSRLHFLKVLDGAPTASVAVHLRRCLTAMSPHGWSRPLAQPSSAPLPAHSKDDR